MRRILRYSFWALVVLLAVVFAVSSCSAADSDGDGLDDDWEKAHGYDPNTPDAVVVIPNSSSDVDSDNDGLVDTWEEANGWDASKDDNPLSTKKNHDRKESVIEYQTGRWSWFTTGIFVTIISFGIFSIAFGAFASRFGQNKSRITGFILLGAGVVILAAFAVLSILKVMSYPDDTIIPNFGLIHWTVQLILVPLASVIGAGIGALGALFFFLVVIMKA